MITLENLSKRYDGAPGFAVRDVSLRVEAGEFLVVLGESGCGKTTTLKMINRLIEPTSGSIFVEGESVSTSDPVALRRRVGYVFQGIGLFPHMTVAENVGAVPRLLHWDKEDVERRVDEVLSLVSLDPGQYRSKGPRELSGGEQQRVGVARALAARPKIMLMDEPFGALDPITRGDIQDEFKELQNRLGLTVIMVTHDMSEALLMADRIAIMYEGRILQAGAPGDVFRNPRHDYVRKLVQTAKRHADRLRNLAGSDDATLRDDA